MSEEKAYPQECAINRDYLCDGSCKWYDFENDDCRMLGMLWKITEAIRDNGEPRTRT